MFGVYIHIPFCRKVCDYCDFRVMPSQSKLFGEFTDLLCKQIVCFEMLHPGLLSTAETLYLGGGTPSELPPEFLRQIFDCLKSVGVDSAKLKEVSIEAYNKEKGKSSDERNETVVKKIEATEYNAPKEGKALTPVTPAKSEKRTILSNKKVTALQQPDKKDKPTTSQRVISQSDINSLF